jgi:glutathione synthase/RimK-type ligase-like ATP-grasp enzyme
VLRHNLSQYAEAVAKKLKLEIAGIDLMQHAESGQLYFIESNVNPGWKGLDETLGTKMAVTIADYILSTL